jgi:hypothetical protein
LRNFCHFTIAQYLQVDPFCAQLAFLHPELRTWCNLA